MCTPLDTQANAVDRSLATSTVLWFLCCTSKESHPRCSTFLHEAIWINGKAGIFQRGSWSELQVGSREGTSCKRRKCNEHRAAYPMASQRWIDCRGTRQVSSWDLRWLLIPFGYHSWSLMLSWSFLLHPVESRLCAFSGLASLRPYGKSNTTHHQSFPDCQRSYPRNTTLPRTLPSNDRGRLPTLVCAPAIPLAWSAFNPWVCRILPTTSSMCWLLERDITASHNLN